MYKGGRQTSELENRGERRRQRVNTEDEMQARQGFAAAQRMLEGRRGPEQRTSSPFTCVCSWGFISKIFRKLSLDWKKQTQYRDKWVVGKGDDKKDTGYHRTWLHYFLCPSCSQHRRQVCEHSMHLTFFLGFSGSTKQWILFQNVFLKSSAVIWPVMENFHS